MKKFHTLFIIVTLFTVCPSFAIESNGNGKEKNNIVIDPPCETYIYGPSTWCINAGTISLTGYVNLDCNGTWSVLAGSGTLNVTGGGASATYIPSPADAGTTVKIILDNDALYCTASGGVITAELDIVITALPGTPGTLTGSSSVCQGQNGVVYSVPSISAATGYNWSLPSGATIIAGSNTNSITTIFSTSATSGNVTVVGTNGCGNGTVSSAFVVTVNPLPGAAGSITGPNSVCQGQNSVSYSVAAIANATGYNWTLPSGASVVAGNNTNSITVNFSGSASGGGVGVTGVNSCGNGTTTMLPISVNPLPLAAGSITGTTNLCAGTNSVSYSVPSITNATGYTWTLPSGVSIANGSNTNSITVNYSVSATSGNVSVIGTNSCGNGASSIIAVNVNPFPVSAGSVSGIAAICQGQNSVTYSVAAITNATGYSWSLPSGAAIASGNNTNTITIDYSVSAASGDIAVYATNGCGNGTTSAAFAVTVHSLPLVTANASATTVCSGNTVILTGGNASSYTWTGGVTNGSPFNPTSTSTYTVTGTDGNGCTNTATQTINVITPATPSICMVTVDDASNYNIIYWDKSSFVNTSADSFIVYRETTSNVYKRLGSISIDSMSSFTDTVRALYFPFTGDPNVGTYRYKLQIRDSCGNLGAMSLFHNTIYANQTGGTFNWNHYQIEGQATPLPQLSAYLLERDNNNTGSWTVIGGVAGSQTSVTDPGYATYPNGRWRISTSWSINCDPTRASINTTRSNIKHTSVATGLNQNELSESTMLYPNPANNEITIEVSEQIQYATLKITNAIGQTVFEETLNSTVNTKILKQIDISNYAKGVYTVRIESKRVKAIKKLVVN